MLPFIILSIRNVAYAVSCEFVREMLVMPAVIHMPQHPTHFRGAISVRDRVIAVVDLRKRLGFPTSGEETADLVLMLEQRRKDHESWLAELLALTTENRPFTKATDPHACAFGKWYDAFQSDSLAISSHLGKFDQPHKRIHAIALKVEECKAKGDFQEAFRIIEETREHQLAEMINLFNEVPAILQQAVREIAVILEIEGQLFGLIVDKVSSTEMLEEHEPTAQELERLKTNPLVQRIAKRKGTEDLVLVLDPKAIVFSEP